MRMNVTNPKARLNITVDKDVLHKTRIVAREKHIPISRLVENFLRFFIDPGVYCFKCGEKFNSTKAKLCAKCGWMICPKCSVCRCGLNEETAIAVFHMRKVYEDLLTGRVK